MKETAPLWSIRGRSNYTHKEVVPGPGSYSPTNSMMHTSPNYRVGTAPRRSLAESSLTPGPGAYTPAVGPDTPKWTM
jgi:hypothetical protein